MAEIDGYLNEILYHQQKKLRLMTDFARDFRQVYQMQREELQHVKESCLAERVTITEMK